MTNQEYYDKYHEEREKQNNKKASKNNSQVKWKIANWCNMIGWALFIWLIWDVFHISEYLFIEWRVYFGIFKFIGAIILLAVAGNLSRQDN